MISQDIKIRITDEGQFNEVRDVLIGHGYKFLFGYEKHLVGIKIYNSSDKVGYYTNCRDFRIHTITEIIKDEIEIYLKKNLLIVNNE